MKKEQVQIIAEIKTLVEKLEVSLKKDGITLPRPAVDKDK